MTKLVVALLTRFSPRGGHTWPQPTLYLRLNAYPNLIHSDYMLNASQMVGNSIIFTSDPAQVGAGQYAPTPLPTDSPGESLR